MILLSSKRNYTEVTISFPLNVTIHKRFTGGTGGKGKELMKRSGTVAGSQIGSQASSQVAPNPLNKDPAGSADSSEQTPSALEVFKNRKEKPYEPPPRIMDSQESITEQINKVNPNNTISNEGIFQKVSFNIKKRLKDMFRMENAIQVPQESTDNYRALSNAVTTPPNMPDKNKQTTSTNAICNQVNDDAPTKLGMSLDHPAKVPLEIPWNLVLKNIQHFNQNFGKKMIQKKEQGNSIKNLNPFSETNEQALQDFQEDIGDVEQKTLQIPEQLKEVTKAQKFTPVIDRAVSSEYNYDILQYKELKFLDIINIIKDENFSENDLAKVFNRMLYGLAQDAYTLEEKETFKSAILEYFDKNPPTIENAEIFLAVWDKGKFKYEYPEHLQKKKNTINAQNADTKEISSKKQIRSKEEFKAKERKTQEESAAVVNKINALFKNMSDHEILESPQTQEWFMHIASRSKKIPFSDEEALINQLYIDLFKRKAPLAEALMQKNNDVFKTCREDSGLPKHLKEKELDKQCITLQDYDKEIHLIEEFLTLLRNYDFTLKGLKYLAILSNAATIDDEGIFKIKDSSYKSFKDKKIADFLKFKYADVNPQEQHIISQILAGEIFIAKEIDPEPESVVPLAHSSHKTLIIKDTISGKTVPIIAGILTSTVDSTTVKVDEYQVTNPDPDKQQKLQMLRILNTFMFEANPDAKPLRIDIRMLLYMRGKNVFGENIPELLAKYYKDAAKSWSNNPYQFTFPSDETFIRNLSIITAETRLEQLFFERKKLEGELSHMVTEDIQRFKAGLEKCKEDAVAKKKEQQYFSLLPKIFQDLQTAIRTFHEKYEKHKEMLQEQEKKKIGKSWRSNTKQKEKKIKKRKKALLIKNKNI